MAITKELEKWLKKTKARHWTGTVYPESMVPNWKDDIDTLTQQPGWYAIHDADVNASDNEERKQHVHLTICFANPTTGWTAFSIFQKIMPTINHIEEVRNISWLWNYTIHDTADAKKKGKHLYPKETRVTFNEFEIGAYEQLSLAEKNILAKEIANIIKDKKFSNMADLYEYVMQEKGDEYFEVLSSKSFFFESLCRGYYHRRCDSLDKEERQLQQARNHFEQEQARGNYERAKARAENVYDKIFQQDDENN